MPKAYSTPLGIITLPNLSSRSLESRSGSYPEDLNLSQTFQRLAGTASKRETSRRFSSASGPVHLTLLHADIAQLLLDLDTLTEKLRSDLGAK